MTESKPTIAVLGGTGDLGTGLARRWARAGWPLVIGSRTAEKGEAAAADLNRRSGRSDIRGMENAAAAAAADIVVMTVPWASHRSTIESVREAVQGKIFVDTTVPLVPPKVGTVQLPPEGSAAVIAQKLLGDEVTVVSAFQNVAAHKLQDEDLVIECDVLVCGDKAAARDAVMALVEAAGLRGWHAGPLANSAAAEAITSVLITLNRRYKIDGAGIRITGTPGSKEP